MLTHQERVALAHALCAGMVARHQDQVLLGAIYGSTVSGMDTSWSDLELLFVVADDSGIATRHLLRCGIAVGLHTVEQGVLVASLRNPDPQWPYWMGVLSTLTVLHGDPSGVRQWLDIGRGVPEARFRQALARHMPELVFESYGRILSCRERGNSDDIGCAAIEMLLEMRTALCLLNGRWVTHDYFQGIVDSFAFSRVPARYSEVAPALWRAHAINEIVPPAEALMNAYRRLLAEEGVLPADDPPLPG